MNKNKSTYDSLSEMQADFYKIFTSGRRIEIIDILRKNEKTVTELARMLRASKGSISQHLTMMKYKGVLATRRDGVSVYYRVSNLKVVEACILMKEVLFERHLNVKGKVECA